MVPFFSSKVQYQQTKQRALRFSRPAIDSVILQTEINLGTSLDFMLISKIATSGKRLKELSDYYGLEGEQPDKEKTRRRIQQQQVEERKRAARKQAFHNALFGEIDRLKDKLREYRLVLENGKIEPFSDLWAYVMNEIQGAEYRLDILTAADMATYRRMKPNSDLGLSSDRPAWLLDCLAILSEIGAFDATEEEIEEITAQRDYELCRVPGRDRRCEVEW